MNRSAIQMRGVHFLWVTNSSKPEFERALTLNKSGWQRV
jgi:hypothetical protein